MCEKVATTCYLLLELLKGLMYKKIVIHQLLRLGTEEDNPELSFSSGLLCFLQPGSSSSSKVRRTRCSSPWSESIGRLTTATSPRAPWKLAPTGEDWLGWASQPQTAYMMPLLVIEGGVPTLASHHLILAVNSREKCKLGFLAGLSSENSCDQLPVMPVRHFACEKSTKNFCFRCSWTFI